MVAKIYNISTLRCAVKSRLFVRSPLETPPPRPQTTKELVKALGNEESSCDDTVTTLTEIKNRLQYKCANSKIGRARGIIPAIVKAMQKYPDNAAVQLKACAILAVLAMCDRNNNTPKIANADGIVAIVEAMKNFPDQAAVQQSACSALISLAPSYPSQIAEAGGISAIVNTTMKNHANKAYLQDEACRALATLGANCYGLLRLIANEGAIAEIVKAMKIHGDKAFVQKSASEALAVLAQHEGSRFRIVEAGGISAIMLAMENHPDTETLRDKACGFLDHLAVNTHAGTT